MTKYEIKTDNFEFRFGTSKDSIPQMSGAEVFENYLNGSANDPHLDASYNTFEEAQAEFSKYYANYARTRAEKGNTFWFLRGEVAWIEENEYDEDSEFDQGGDVWVYLTEPYEVEE